MYAAVESGKQGTGRHWARLRELYGGTGFRDLSGAVGSAYYEHAIGVITFFPCFLILSLYSLDTPSKAALLPFSSRNDNLES